MGVSTPIIPCCFHFIAQQRERLFTTGKFPRVLPGGQAEDPHKTPRMSTGNLIFTQPAIAGKRGLQSGKKDCSLLQSCAGEQKENQSTVKHRSRGYQIFGFCRNGHELCQFTPEP
jgi:hypothetical protein